MNPTSTTHKPHPGIDQPTGPAHSLRPFGADRAQGFAQIMGAFVTDPVERQKSAPTPSDARGNQTDRVRAPGDGRDSDKDRGASKSTKQGDGASTEQATDQTVDPAKATQSGPAATNEDAPTDADASQGSGPHAQPRTDAHANTADEPGGTEPPSLGRETSMRLLHNQSDQAKLSIKGLVRSLTHAAGVDLTDIAVDTRLGRDETIAQPPSDKQAHAGPATKSHPATHDAPRTPSGPPHTPFQTVPQHPTETRDAQAPLGPGGVSPAGTAARGPADDASDQARPDVQQNRSMRADAGTAPRAGRSSLTSETTVRIQPETTGQAARATRGSSAQSVRAVTASETPQFDSPLRDAPKTAGSLVEKMSRPAIPEGGDRGGLLAQVQRGMASLLRSGNGDMTLKLTPVNLGEIRIRIKSLGDRLSVRFEASNDRGRELLKGGIDDLAAQLRAKGVKLGQLSIDHRDASPQTPAHAPNDPQQGHGAHNAQGGHTQTTQDQPAGDQGGHRDNPGHEPGGGAQPDNHGTDEPLPAQPEPIWTELGLDAIA